MCNRMVMTDMIVTYVCIYIDGGCGLGGGVGGKKRGGFFFV